MTLAALITVFFLSGCAVRTHHSGMKEGRFFPPEKVRHAKCGQSERNDQTALETDQVPDKPDGPLREARIIIDKTERKLFLYSGDELIKTYPVRLGLDPVGDKEKAGDRRTPEGSFYICTKNPKSRFFLSLGLSYPNKEDAERGLSNGLITREQYRAIVQAIEAGRKPPWNTPLGGAICIHGGGIAWDWTHGCIALQNKDVQELYRILPVGTPVTVCRKPTLSASLSRISQ